MCKRTSAFCFGAEPSVNLRECLQDSVLMSVGVTAHQRRLLSSAAASSERASALILRSRCYLSWQLKHFSFSKRAISERAISTRAPRATGLLLKMAFCSCVSGCGLSWLHLTVTIAVSRAWAISTLKQHLWINHILIAGT